MIKLTKYGKPQVIAYPLAIIAAMITAWLLKGFVSPDWVLWPIEAALLIVLLWMLSFFRDPKRKIPQETNILLSPADGLIDDIETIEYPDLCPGPVLRIGIFLNVFNVHINRVPCAVNIDAISYKKGHFKNAIDPESARVNEANDIYMTRIDTPTDKLLVRQISGAIARHIVCDASSGDNFSSGQQFGMIKFGSRTQLYLPLTDSCKVLAKKGQKAKAGLTKLVEYKNG